MPHFAYTECAVRVHVEWLVGFYEPENSNSTGNDICVRVIELWIRDIL